jgi:hypothetical protein
MTLLVSELALATHVMREGRLNRALPSGLPFYLRSACRAQNTPALRTHALLSRIPTLRLCEVRTPSPRQAGVPFRRFCPVAEGVGRVGTPSGQACTADSGQTKETELNTMFNKVILIGRLGQNAEAKTAQNNREYVNHQDVCSSICNSNFELKGTSREHELQRLFYLATTLTTCTLQAYSQSSQAGTPDIGKTLGSLCSPIRQLPPHAYDK